MLRVAAAMTAAGWGANHFAPLLLAYRAERGLSEQVVTGIFVAYVAGLVPALLGAAWLSQHRGNRPLVRAAMVLMLLGSLVQLMGADAPALLVVGRIVTGVGIGCVMGPGTAWVKELSAGTPPGTGARRAALALTAGFGVGPLVSGALAQWLPAPLTLPHALHLVVQALAAAWVWNVPETRHGDRPTPSVRDVVHHVRSAWFLRVVLPAAPWVFGCATVSFAVVPSVVGPLPGIPIIAAAGVMAGLTLGTSVLVQPLVKRFAVTHARAVLVQGLVVATVGMGLATASALWPNAAWLPVTAVVLGTGHALTVVGCMSLVEIHTPAPLMAAMTAVTYCLTYVGFLAPWVVSLLALLVPVWVVLLVGAAVAALTTGWLAAQPRRAAD